MATLKNTIIDDTAFLKLPVGTTAQRSAGGAGRTRFNSTTNQLEVHDGTAWNPIWQLSGYITSATGGTVSWANTSAGNFKIHTFTSSGTLTLNTIVGVPNVEYLIVAGGGGGGSDAGGGGGGGGVVHGFTEALRVGTYAIAVGSGGAGGEYNPGMGNSSYIARDQATLDRGIRSFGNDTGYNPGTELAFGGGGGSNGQNQAGAGGVYFDSWQSDFGGCGGGAGPLESLGDFTFTALLPGIGTLKQGTRGGNSMNYPSLGDNQFKGGGGGGGAQRPGKPAPNGGSPVYGGGSGGDGYLWRGAFANGAAVYYGGGGSGGSGTYPSGQPYNINSLGGGGKGGFNNGGPRVAAENGGTNTGGGGGGANVSTGSTPGTDRFAGGAGGSGIVIIKYRFS
jgi:fibronectin-binding autotransporter adhesin